MAQTKTIQLLRSSQAYADIAAAKTALEGQTTGRKDGEILLARYWQDNEIKSLLGIFHAAPDLTGTGITNNETKGWTFIQDQSTVDAILDGLDANTNVTKTGSGSGATYAATDSSMVIVGVMQEDGQVTSVATAIKDVVLTGYQEGTDADIAATDTLGQALGKLQAQINAMDLTEVGGTDGDVIVAISEADGKVSATKSSLTDVKMTGYSKTSNTGAIAATDTLEQAFSKVENAIAKNTVSSADKTVKIDTTGATTDLAVNIDGTTLVKNSSTGVISADLAVVKLDSTEVTALSDANVKEAYKLIYRTDSNRTAIGDVVKVYKDSALKEVYLGDASDTVDSTNGTVTKYAYQLISDPTTKITAAAYDELTAEQKALYEAVDGQSLNYVYQLANGTYSIVPVDVSKFLSESEYGDGLQVVSGVVSVKKDTNSGKVRTADTPSGVTPGSAQDTGLVDVLTVSSNGVKVDNIQAAITYATGNLAVSAEGDNYITAAVDANNNKKINVTADVQNLTATAGTPGTYNSSTGAETTAPVAGTLSGVANSLGDAADIATKVKTYVDGAIAIEAARNDAKNKADIAALDGEALASTAPTAVTYSGTNSDEFQVLTRVNEVDGIIQTVDATANSAGSKSVTLKKVAATGAAADVSIADSGNLITATTVEGALQEIAANVRDNAIVNNDVITVTNDSTNHNTKLAVTTGNGLEKTGNNNDTLAVKAYNGINVTSNGVGVTIDTTSTGHSDMLSVGANGILLSNTWDCGTF